VILWDVTTRRQLVPSLVGAREPVMSLAFSPDGTRLAAGGGRDTASAGELLVWDLANPVSPRRPTEAERPHPKPIQTLAFSADGKTLMSASSDGAMAQWDVATLACRSKWTGQPFASAAFHAAGGLLAAGGRSGVGTRRIVDHPFGLILWDLASGGARGVAPPKEVDDVRSVVFGPDDILAAGTDDGRVMLWNVGGAEPELARTLVGHKVAVTSLAFAPDGAFLLSGAEDGTVILRDLRSREPVARSLSHAGTEQAAKSNPFYHLEGVALTSDGKTMASEGAGGKVVLWDVASGTPQRELTGNGAPATSLAFTVDDRSLVAATQNGMVVWDVAGGLHEGKPAGPPEMGDRRTVTLNGTTVALAMPDHSVRLWDVPGRVVIGAPLRGHQAKVTDLAFSRDGKTLASGSADGIVVLWNVGNQQPLTSPLRHDAGGIDMLRFDHDGTTLAVAASRADTSAVTLWNVRTRERTDFAIPPSVLLWDATPVRMVFSPRGTLLVVAVRSGAIRLWDVAHRRPFADALLGHSKSVVALGFSGDGQTLFSVDTAGTARVWDLVQRLPVGSVEVGRVRTAVFSSDARVMAASAEWGPRLVLVDWDATSWSRYACAAANRTLTSDEWQQFVGADVEPTPACGPLARSLPKASLWDWRPAFWGRPSRANR
jgi:WD40 repeat protein